MKYFSMFSGIGGFELGLQNSKYDFESVGASEIDKYAASIYARHFPEHRNYGDATQINTEELEDFEFLVGGFPCQAFSIAGKRKGFDDTRGTLFFEIARVLRDKKPTYFLLENVKGLLSHEGGGTLQTIFKILDELGYDVSWAIYNSKDYGVPQNRERIFIKGYLRSKCGRKVLSIPRVNRTVNAPVSNQYYGTRHGRIHKDDEIMNCLATQGHNGGGSQLIQLNNDEKHSQGERVYSDEGIACTINAAGNNNWYRIRKVGSVNNDQGGATYDPNGISPCLCSGDLSHNGGINIVEQSNRSIKKVGNVRNGHHAGDVLDTDGITPTLTACQYKDPIKIVEPKPNKIGNVSPSGKSQGWDIFDPNGLSPTICAVENGQSNVKVIQPKIKKMGNINPSKSGHGGVVYSEDGLSPTLCVGKGEGVKIARPVLTPERENKRQNGRRMKDNDEPMFTLTAQDKHGVYDGYLLRKLTPVECERLQGFPDGWTEFGKDGERISDTQRYKCCGNAVTTNVITAIVDEMFDGLDII